MQYTWSSRGVTLAAVVSTMALGLAACSAPASTPTPPPAAQTPSSTPTPEKISGDIQLWHFWTDREATVIQAAVDNFTKLYPDIKVTVKSGQDDDKTSQAISAGQPVDVAISGSSDQVGPMCSSGAFLDLAQYIQRDNVDLGDIPSVVQSYTQFNGVRCTLPLLSDTYALYYNKGEFAKAGITDPPKTLDELTADAVKLTTYNSDGSIKQLGFMPLMDYYETSEPHLAVATQAKWLNDDGTSAIGTDPGWPMLYNWQKDLIDKLGGYAKLAKWQSAGNDEWSAQNDFETGRLAMEVDGEFRTAFFAADKSKVDYGTAPLPMAADQTDKYGAGYITGNIIGIGKGSKNPEAAWQLVKYLALNTDAQVQMGNGLKNVPTLTSAQQSPSLEIPAGYQVFLDVFAHPNTQTTPPSSIGGEYQSLLAQFSAQWASGKQTDLVAGLKAVDDQINAKVELSG